MLRQNAARTQTVLVREHEVTMREFGFVPSASPWESLGDFEPRMHRLATRVVAGPPLDVGGIEPAAPRMGTAEKRRRAEAGDDDTKDGSSPRSHHHTGLDQTDGSGMLISSEATSEARAKENGIVLDHRDGDASGGANSPPPSGQATDDLKSPAPFRFSAHFKQRVREHTKKERAAQEE